MAEREVVYKDVCEERYTNIVAHLEEIKAAQREERQAREKREALIMDLLRGTNGNPGLVDKVRDNTKAIKRIWIGTYTFAAFVVLPFGESAVAAVYGDHRLG